MSEMDPCMKFIQDVQVMKYRLKQSYDELVIKQVRLHPQTLGEVIGSSSMIGLMGASNTSEEQLSKIAGYEVVDDVKVPKYEIYYVVKKG